MSKFLAGSANAMYRFGLLGNNLNNSNPIPKFSDLWYLELYTNGEDNVTNVYSQSVKSVSEIQINVTHTSIDQYGKRIHVPQRVDFPAVTIVLYDTVDGKIFNLAKSIFEYGFKNNSTNDKGTDTAIRDISSSGLKNKTNSGARQPQNHFFTEVNIYHFGSIATDGQRSKKHKITLSNPLVSNITFSNSDYSTSELRTITMTLEPENVFIDSDANPDTIPSWITMGVNTLN